MRYGLISACLIGVPCRYDGRAKSDVTIQSLMRNSEEVCWIPVCPEQLGGLTTPRAPAEIIGDRVINDQGEDVTAEFEKGSLIVADMAELYHADFAILKEGSPSCGSSRIYDGTFSNVSIPGAGLTTKKLREMGIRVHSEENFDAILSNMNQNNQTE